MLGYIKNSLKIYHQNRLGLSAIFACLSFIAMAIYGWGLSWQQVQDFSAKLLLLLVIVMILAALTVAVWVFFKYLMKCCFKP